MAYDQKLAERIRHALGGRKSVSEKKMFGGLAFLVGGKMLCGIVKDDLMVRVGPERYGEALRRPHVRPMDFTGRPMKGFVFVGPAACGTDEAVTAWVELGADFVAKPDGPRGGRRGHTKPARQPGRSS